MICYLPTLYSRKKVSFFAKMNQMNALIWAVIFFVGEVTFFFNFYFYFILLYNTVLVLPYIDMNPPQVYMRSQTWTSLPPPSP